MQKKLLDKLCCPFDKEELNVKIFKQDDQDEIIEGILTCNTCNRYYPIIYSIPIMSPDEYREKQLEGPVLQRWGYELDSSKTTFQLNESSAKKLL